MLCHDQREEITKETGLDQTTLVGRVATPPIRDPIELHEEYASVCCVVCHTRQRMEAVVVAFEDAAGELGELEVVLTESDGLATCTVHQRFSSGVLQHGVASWVLCDRIVGEPCPVVVTYKSKDHPPKVGGHVLVVGAEDLPTRHRPCCQTSGEGVICARHERRGNGPIGCDVCRRHGTGEGRSLGDRQCLASP